MPAPVPDPTPDELERRAGLERAERAKDMARRPAGKGRRRELGVGVKRWGRDAIEQLCEPGE